MTVTDLVPDEVGDFPHPEDDCAALALARALWLATRLIQHFASRQTHDYLHVVSKADAVAAAATIAAKRLVRVTILFERPARQFDRAKEKQNAAVRSRCFWST